MLLLRTQRTVECHCDCRDSAKWIQKCCVMIFSIGLFHRFGGTRNSFVCTAFVWIFAPHVHTLQLTGPAEMLFGRVKLLIIRFSSFLVVFIRIDFFYSWLLSSVTLVCGYYFDRLCAVRYNICWYFFSSFVVLLWYGLPFFHLYLAL